LRPLKDDLSNPAPISSIKITVERLFSSIFSSKYKTFTSTKTVLESPLDNIDGHTIFPFLYSTMTSVPDLTSFDILLLVRGSILFRVSVISFGKEEMRLSIALLLLLEA
jgi:hypothetical protein